MQRHLMQVDSEFDKERALLEQKIVFIETAMEEKSARERDYMTEWQSQKSEMSVEIKAVQSKYELELKILQ